MFVCLFISDGISGGQPRRGGRQRRGNRTTDYGFIDAPPQPQSLIITSSKSTSSNPSEKRQKGVNQYGKHGKLL